MRIMILLALFVSPVVLLARPAAQLKPVTYASGTSLVYSMLPASSVVSAGEQKVGKTAVVLWVWTQRKPAGSGTSVPGWTLYDYKTPVTNGTVQAAVYTRATDGKTLSFDYPKYPGGRGLVVMWLFNVSVNVAQWQTSETWSLPALSSLSSNQMVLYSACCVGRAKTMSVLPGVATSSSFSFGTDPTNGIHGNLLTSRLTPAAGSLAAVPLDVNDVVADNFTSAIVVQFVILP